jgi:hypothetical protein
MLLMLGAALITQCLRLQSDFLVSLADIVPLEKKIAVYCASNSLECEYFSSINMWKYGVTSTIGEKDKQNAFYASWLTMKRIVAVAPGYRDSGEWWKLMEACR